MAILSLCLSLAAMSFFLRCYCKLLSIPSLCFSCEVSLGDIRHKQSAFSFSTPGMDGIYVRGRIRRFWTRDSCRWLQGLLSLCLSFLLLCRFVRCTAGSLGCFHHSWIFLPFTGCISGLILDDARLHADICISERDEAGSPIGILDMELYSRKIVVASSFGRTGLSLPRLGRKRTRRRTGRRVCLSGLIYWDIYSDYFLRDLLRIMWWRTDVDDGIPQFDFEARTGG
ncbi:hypothetical protein QBC33DRAFT_360203 [Phialemonium atrogriseum]|uniref:Uncharacterized protein n=1 Tax=Phialemonium atrogriseum TaxID=1093897 RepID=A0AAJ0FNA7_9PEZI|nr:uncharacterized protein QBC33DRAFT_360203 [Phialemonium atrogriseum]KAK1768794.1 hypothetical protein QBC33DRAFT_360203 [Phialemonium atrogriseum]